MSADWTLFDGHATLERADVTTRVWLDRPALGIGGWTSHETERVLGVELPGFPDPISAENRVDHYVRDGDLVVTYERRAPPQLRSQIYWRDACCCLTDVSLPGVEVWISLQTDRLDARPTLKVVTQLVAAELIEADPAWCGDLAEGVVTVAPPLLLWRLPGDEFSLVQLVVPGDVASIRRSLDATSKVRRCELCLLDEHLEKGVIRRIRLGLWRVPRPNDVALARQLCERFLNAPLPLTT